MPDDVTLNSNPLAMFDRITTTVGILRQTFYFMTGFHSRRWYEIHDLPHSYRLWLQFPRLLHARRRLRHGLPKCFIYYAFRHVNNDVGVHCLILILVQYLLQHRGDVVCHPCLWWHQPQHLWRHHCKHAMQNEMACPQSWQHSTRGTKCSTPKRHC